MPHKFASLIEVASIWHSLSNANVVKVAEHVLAKDVVGLYTKAVISGIFKQIYDQGEMNDDLFFTDLLVLSQELMKSQSKDSKSPNDEETSVVESKLEQLPDNVLSYIASYLNSTNLFTQWNHVNRKLLQIGLKPESMEKLIFDISEYRINRNIRTNPPHFKCDVTSIKSSSISLKTLNLDCFVHKSSMNHLKSVVIGGGGMSFL